MVITSAACMFVCVYVFVYARMHASDRKCGTEKSIRYEFISDGVLKSDREEKDEKRQV